MTPNLKNHLQLDKINLRKCRKEKQKISRRNKEPTEEEIEKPILTHQKLFEILDEHSITYEPNDSQMETTDFTQEQSKGIFIYSFY